MLDMLGKQMMSTSFNLVEGNNQYSFDVSLFSKGLFILIIERDGLSAETIRVVVD